MKLIAYFLTVAVGVSLGGCTAPSQVASEPPTKQEMVPTPLPVATVVPTSTTAPKIVRSNRSSLPTMPQMMGNSPRPTFFPAPTPKVRPGQTIVISNARATPKPRENPTIIVSNAPILGTNISPQAAAARELVWVNTQTMTYHRPGARGFGGVANGFYITEAQARGRGYRAAPR